MDTIDNNTLILIMNSIVPICEYISGNWVYFKLLNIYINITSSMFKSIRNLLYNKVFSYIHFKFIKYVYGV